MQSIATAPFQYYAAQCTVLQPLHFNNIMHHAQY